MVQEPLIIIVLHGCDYVGPKFGIVFFFLVGNSYYLRLYQRNVLYQRLRLFVLHTRFEGNAEVMQNGLLFHYYAKRARPGVAHETAILRARLRSMHSKRKIPDIEWNIGKYCKLPRYLLLLHALLNRSLLLCNNTNLTWLIWMNSMNHAAWWKTSRLI